jgi:hypothetical protein
MTLECPLCGGRMAPGRHVCTPCEDALLRDLDDIPSLDKHLHLALSRQVAIGERGNSHSTETALSWDERARTAITHLHSVLAGWTRVLRKTARPGAHRTIGPRCWNCKHRTCLHWDLARGPRDDLTAMANWLTRHRQVLLGLPAADEALDQIHRALRDARYAIDRPPTKIYAGPCDECGHDLLAQPGATEVACGTCLDDEGCTLVYPVAARQEWMRAETEDLLGNSAWVSAIVTQLGVKVSQSAIRMWVKRGKLTPRTFLPPRTVGGEPRPMYRVGDVIEVARRKLSAAPDRRTP